MKEGVCVCVCVLSITKARRVRLKYKVFKEFIQSRMSVAISLSKTEQKRPTQTQHTRFVLQHIHSIAGNVRMPCEIMIVLFQCPFVYFLEGLWEKKYLSIFIYIAI